jgi:hypothetical protein
MSIKVTFFTAFKVTKLTKKICGVFGGFFVIHLSLFIETEKRLNPFPQKYFIFSKKVQ